MNIIFATDDNYARYAATAIVSLVRMHPGISLNISVLDSGMTEKSRERLRSFATDKVDIRLHDLHRVQAFANCLNLQTSVTTASFSRFFIPELFPNEQRALYLDADILVLRPLQELYHSDMGGRALRMVQDPGAVSNCHRLRLPRYFNSGVILFDLERCRRLQFTRRWQEYLDRRSQPLPFADQDVINIVSQQEIDELPACYNMQSNPSLLGNTEAIRSAWEQVVVLHFITNHKPWLTISHPFDKVYLQTMLDTPWASEVPPLRRRKRLHRLRCCFWCWRLNVTENHEKRKTLYVLGIPLFSRFTSPTRRTLYLFGIPFFTLHRRTRVR